MKLKKWHRIFVNRSLNMSKIRAIGFDMDHTIATYNREAFESLAFRETLKKFIEAGYPKELQELTFDPSFLQRGLLIDMNRGNVLKVDGHKYVKTAIHGHQRLDKITRHELYNNLSFKAGEFLSIDTFFALSEGQLFAEIIDYMSKNPGAIRKSYREVYQDLRKFIDLSHADGSIKRQVVKDLGKFFVRDKHLLSTLKTLHEAGKKMFLLTNSAWDYTAHVMDYLFFDPESEYSWRDLFDWTIVSAGKPSFFVGQQPFHILDPKSHKMQEFTGERLVNKDIYVGGNARQFEQLTDIRGDEILYIGDHLYGDIIRSKDSVNWRTMLIVEELEEELIKLDKLKSEWTKIKARVREREDLDEEIHILRSRIFYQNRLLTQLQGKGDKKKINGILKDNKKNEEKAKTKETQLEKMDREIKGFLEERSAHFHPLWGELMKVGLAKSRFADQVSEYACVYTSKVSNFRYYSPFKRFSSTHDILAHEL